MIDQVSVPTPRKVSIPIEVWWTGGSALAILGVIFVGSMLAERVSPGSETSLMLCYAVPAAVAWSILWVISRFRKS
ncbi:MAG: hypothetical protein U1E50_02105 [Caulobacteraceae bacterium]